MTEKEFAMAFGEWCNAVMGTAYKLTEFGDIDYRDPGRREAYDQYHELWMQVRKSYVFRDKNEKITSALLALRKAGIDCHLCSYQNGHIKAISRHGVVYSYYATTGTIAGYNGTEVSGLESLLRLCKA